MSNEIECEKCLICGTITKIPKDMHIANRTNYIEGAGQLCEKCYAEIYKDKNAKNKKNSRGV